MIRKGSIGLLICLLTLFFNVGTAQSTGVYAETPLGDIGENQKNNIRLAVQAINGTKLSFGEEFSFNQIVGERSEERGFLPAKNGRGVEVVGGGVAQTATTLYLALMQRDDIAYSSIYTYNENFTGGYVDSGYDAIATDYKAGLDFAFDSFCKEDLTVFIWMDDQSVCCYVTEDEEEFANGLQRSGYSEILLNGSEEERANVQWAAMSIDGLELEAGDVFSFSETIGLHTDVGGYQSALNEQGIETIGGVKQAASAVYMAVCDIPNVEVIEIQFDGEDYNKDDSENKADVALSDYDGGPDFAFEYHGDGVLTIYMYVEQGWLICEVYDE